MRAYFLNQRTHIWTLNNDKKLRGLGRLRFYGHLKKYSSDTRTQGSLILVSTGSAFFLSLLYNRLLKQPRNLDLVLFPKKA